MIQTKNKSISIIEHKEKKIYYLNHSCLTGKDLIQDVEECEKVLGDLQNILVLANYSHTEKCYNDIIIYRRSNWKKVAILDEDFNFPIFSDKYKLAKYLNAKLFKNKNKALNYLVA